MPETWEIPSREERRAWKVRVWKEYTSKDYEPYWSLQEARNVIPEHDDADYIEIYTAILVYDYLTYVELPDWTLPIGGIWEKLEDETWYRERGDGHRKLGVTKPIGNPYVHTVEELRKMCKERGLDHRGNKIDLIKRLFGKSYGAGYGVE